ncbi:MAG: oligopeptide:H+ symporter [Methanobrevibacter sp.]|nr:oligopeptide:H+ symporter [Methanobrevibacter sp.]
MGLNKENRIFKFSKSFYALFFTELWERFSYYGMKAILLFYIYFTFSDGGLGLPQSTAASIVAIYAALIYLVGILGGYLGDRLLGSYKTVLYGSILIMFGHITLSVLYGMNGLFLGLLVVIIGSGLLKPNISKMVGELYPDRNGLRDSAFYLYYFGIYIGAFISPILTGWFGFNYNFHYGFGLAAIGMFIGILCFYFVNKDLFNEKSFDKIQKHEIKSLFIKVTIGAFGIAFILFLMNLFNCFSIDNLILLVSIFIIIIPFYLFYSTLSSKKITKMEYSNVLIYVPLFIATVIYWILQEQVGLTILLFVEKNVQLGWIPPSWILSLDSFFLILLTPVFLYFRMKLGNKQSTTAKKSVYALIVSGLAFLILSVSTLMTGYSNKISILWIILPNLLIMLGQVLIAPTTLSTIYKLAPKFFKSRMMSLWYISNAAGQAINSQIVKYFIHNETTFFMILAIIPIIFAVFLYFNINKIDKALNI